MNHIKQHLIERFIQKNEFEISLLFHQFHIKLDEKIDYKSDIREFLTLLFLFEFYYIIFDNNIAKKESYQKKDQQNVREKENMRIYRK